MFLAEGGINDIVIDGVMATVAEESRENVHDDYFDDDSNDGRGNQEDDYFSDSIPVQIVGTDIN